MAITSADIQEQIFTIDRKGYNSDEVDVFLERVADEVDYLNTRIKELEEELAEAQDASAHDTHIDAPASAAPAVSDSEYESKLLEKDAQIASLNAQLEQRRADANAIAQALIVAQRSADSIVADAKSQAAEIVEEAEGEKAKILEEAENERQAVSDEIDELEDERDSVREDYQEMLKNFISDATLKLAGIEDDKPARSAHARVTPSSASSSAPAKAKEKPNYQVPVNNEPKFDTSSFSAAASQPVVVAATPVPVESEKDFSGFGDVDDDFGFDDLD
jgi:cell division initiation protein